ncbi:MAG: hypothetical protein LQ352_004113 [Teloschistes flavicans]|nr:MAG: hypothetical protein LQ352_004113 [Teloschistes flavicans]
MILCSAPLPPTPLMLLGLPYSQNKEDSLNTPSSPRSALHGPSFTNFTVLIVSPFNGIRQGYWALHAAAIAGETIRDDDIPMMYSPAHIRHCIDLIRHSLVCRPDMTVEVKDPEIGGVTGFGTEHQCRNWEELMRWTGKWEGWRQDPRAQDDDAEGMEMKHKHHGHDG